MMFQNVIKYIINFMVLSKVNNIKNYIVYISDSLKSLEKYHLQIFMILLQKISFATMLLGPTLLLLTMLKKIQ